MAKRGSKLYSKDRIDEAVLRVDKVGLAQATRELGIPRSTLHDWCKAANVASSSEKLHAQTEAATEASRQRRKRMAEESNERMTLALAIIAEQGAQVEIDIMRAIKEGKPFPELVGKNGRVSLSELVGSRTRAVHDLQLLAGKATERAAVDEGTTTAEVLNLQDQLRKRRGA